MFGFWAKSVVNDLEKHLIGIRIDKLDKHTRQWDELVNNPAYDAWLGSACTLL